MIQPLCRIINKASEAGLKLDPMVIALFAGDEWEIARQAATLQKKLEPKHDIMTLIDAWKLVMGLM